MSRDLREGALALLPSHIDFDSSPLRQLRLWHWRQATFCAKMIAEHGIESEKAKPYRKGQTTHMQAAQALNDLFPIGDTAAHDAEKQDVRSNG